VIQRVFVVVALAALAVTADARAQEVTPETARPVSRAAARPGPATPVDLHIVISKFQGDKKTSSVPYTVAVNAAPAGIPGERAQLTIGSDVAVPTTTFTAATDGKTTQPLVSYNYRNVGTVISAAAVSIDDGRFEVDISIDESSVGTNAFAQGTTAAMPVFKSFKTRNKVPLRNGQTREFIAATERVSGETVKIEVTLTVVK
jgi:hypothetical protein